MRISLHANGVEILRGSANGPAAHEEVIKTIRLFGRYAIPHFREKEKVQAGATAAAKNSIGAAGQIATELGGPSGEALHASANSAFVDGFTMAMAVVAGITFIGVLLVARFMPGRESFDEPDIILEASEIQLAKKVSLSPVPVGSGI